MKPMLPNPNLVDTAINFAKKCFSRPQFKHFRKYIGGLIALPHKSIKSISRGSIDGGDQSSLNRFITSSPWNEQALERRYLQKVQHTLGRERASLILDDSLSKKTGTHIADVQYHKDHSGDGFIFGHQMVTALVKVRDRVLPLFPKLYSRSTPTKIAFAKELITHADDNLRLKEVILDSWYTATEIIKVCLRRKLDAIGCIKSNRNISLVPGVWVKLSTYRTSLQEEDFIVHIIDEETYRIHEKIVRLKHIGFVKLLISQQWNAEDQEWSRPFHLMSTSTIKTACQIIRTYAQRWSIETFHRDIKQNLGLGAYQVRGRKGIIRHLMLVVLAYAALKFWMCLQDVRWTIGEAIRILQSRALDELIITIVEENDQMRRRVIAQPYLSESAKV